MSDYISREAVLLHLNDIWLSASPTDTMYDDDRQLAMVRCMGLNDAMDVVKEAPAADVRPVARGRWEWDVLDGTPGYRPVVLCWSNCHRVSFSGWDFCPNCGALMEES